MRLLRMTDPTHLGQMARIFFSQCCGSVTFLVRIRIRGFVPKIKIHNKSHKTVEIKVFLTIFA
jgi:hypothetical protein